MSNITYTIPNINCSHCVHTIKMEIGEIAGVKSVDGDPTSKKVTISYEPPATEEKIISVLKEINYAPQV
jgi:copper chaperone